MQRAHITSSLTSTRAHQPDLTLDPARTLLISCFDATLPLERMGLATRAACCAEVRTPAHLVSPWAAGSEEACASLMLSLSMRETRDVVICGHVGCKALEAFIDEDRGWQVWKLLASMPAARATIDLVRRNYGELEEDALREVLAQENVLTQLDHLLTYPGVKQSSGPRVHAWLYDERDTSLWKYSFTTWQFTRSAEPATSVFASAE
jgi:carbonic anhydrase